MTFAGQGDGEVRSITALQKRLEPFREVPGAAQRADLEVCLTLSLPGGSLHA